MEWLFSWEVTSVVVGILIAIGLGVLALDDFKLAKTFFLVAAADAAGGMVMWGIKTDAAPFLRMGVVFVCMGAIGVMAVQSLRYVDGKRAQKQPPSSEGQGRGDLFIDFHLGPLPTSSPDGRIYALTPFPIAAANGGGGLAEYFSGSNKFLWTDKDHPNLMAQKYTITNYSEKTLVNIEMNLHLTFLEAKTQEGGGTTSGAVTLSRDWPIVIAKIDPGPGNAFTFYAFNNTLPNWIRVELPTDATGQVIGQIGRQVFRIARTEGQVMPLAPYENKQQAK